MRKYLTTQIFDFNIFADDVSVVRIEEEKIIISTLNAYSYVVSTHDKLFKDALQHSTILLPDGFPVVVAARWLNHLKIKKIAGADIFQYLCSYMNKHKGSCFFLGSSVQTLEMISQKMKEDYPDIRHSNYSPPYKNEFSPEDNQLMFDAVKSFSPDVLFVGMTAPKQEKWVYRYSEDLNARIICSIGAVFDFYAGSVSRPSGFWVKHNLEWFIRLLKEPKRLWKRYLIYSPLFFLHLLRFSLFRRNSVR